MPLGSYTRCKLLKQTATTTNTSRMNTNTASSSSPTTDAADTCEMWNSDASVRKCCSQEQRLSIHHINMALRLRHHLTSFYVLYSALARGGDVLLFACWSGRRLFVCLSPVKFVKSFATWQHLTSTWGFIVSTPIHLFRA